MQFQKLILYMNNQLISNSKKLAVLTDLAIQVYFRHKNIHFIVFKKLMILLMISNKSSQLLNKINNLIRWKNQRVNLKPHILIKNKILIFLDYIAKIAIRFSCLFSNISHVQKHIYILLYF